MHKGKTKEPTMSDETLETPVVLEQVWEVTMSNPWTGKLIEALAKAQLEFKSVLKQTDNAAFMRGGRASKYADLAEYIDATQEPLAKNGLVVTQWPDVSPEAKSMSLVSFLMHSSGEWMRGKLTLPAIGRDGFTAQSCGSSITYARRYSYAAITGCASEDDDGNSASGRGTSEAAQEVAKAKIEAIKPILSLFYCWHNESQTAEITGAESLKKLNKDLLKNLWSANARAIIANAEQLEYLKLRLEERGVPFAQLKAAS
jgi:hypothetical protein